MKRKTFIKQLMGRYCVERNAANGMAKAVHLSGGSYVTGLQRYDQNVRTWAETFGLPHRLLLTREKGANKAHRRHMKSQKRAAHVIVYTHQNKPAPGAMVTVRMGRSNNQQEAGGAAV